MRRNDIVYLHDAAKFSKESLLKIRNMGIETYNELREQCEKYGVVIYSEEELKDKSRGINWSWNLKIKTCLRSLNILLIKTSWKKCLRIHR